MTELIEKENIVEQPRKISMASYFAPLRVMSGNGAPWASDEVDKFGLDPDTSYKELVNKSRFFYSHDPIAATVINKLIDIGISEIEFIQKDSTDNDFRIFQGLKKDLQLFIENCALEYLLSGLVVPEIRFTAASPQKIKEMGLKKVSSVRIPTELWVRDSSKIKINGVFILGDKSYFVEIPDDIIHFIQTGGDYPDGTSDPSLYRKLVELYPEFVRKIISGDLYVLLENPYVIERRSTTSNLYPQPYLLPALESLQHKRNLRKMDYSIASRVISAIQKITLGDKDFPLLEDDETQLQELKKQMLWRDGSNRHQDRIFQLFGNHTLKIEWIFPPVDALIDDRKYKDVNDDILFGLGFPRILITGESERTGTSDPEYAILSPLKTMEAMRDKFRGLLEHIVNLLGEYNKITKLPEVQFKQINLHNYLTFLTTLGKLYESGNLSREDYAKAFGYDLATQLEKRRDEKEVMEKYQLDEFSPLPHSNAPGSNPSEKPVEKPKSKTNSKNTSNTTKEVENES